MHIKIDETCIIRQRTKLLYLPEIKIQKEWPCGPNQSSTIFKNFTNFPIESYVEIFSRVKDPLNRTTKF